MISHCKSILLTTDLLISKTCSLVPAPHQARGQTRHPGENNIGSMLSLEMTRKGLWTESGDGHHRLGFSFRLSMAMATNTRVYFLIECESC